MLQYRIALQSLRMNRARTGLTTLGIIIGVASLTLVLALGNGVENAIHNQVSKLDDNVILVASGSDTSLLETVQRYNPYGISATTSLTEQDYNIIRLDKNIDKAAPIMLLTGSVSTNQENKKNVPIVATTADLTDILNLSVKPGEFVNNATTRDTAVIGAKLADELFHSNQILGQQFMLKGRTHMVVGVLKTTNTPINLSGIDLDRAVIISFDDGKSFNQGVAQIQQMLISSKAGTSPDTVTASVDAALLTNHKGEHDFAVLAGQKVAEHGNASFKAAVFMTAIVAAITLAVGGIGIMNIMLVGVSERTREIGIRKALGATDSHILGQFLIEALIMCITGGIIGISLGYGLAYLIALQLAFEPALTWQIAALGLGMALTTGILFGLYPAFKAARKNPIESLRQYH